MTADLEEIKPRLENLERYLQLLESRVDSQEGLLKLHGVGIKPTLPSDTDDAQPSALDAEDAPPCERDLDLQKVDHLLSSIVLKQGMHNTDLREALRGQERLRLGMRSVTGMLDSIQQTVQDIRRELRAPAGKRETN
jgi:hypothetical protein